MPLASIRWIPSGQPGHRGAPAAGVEHRLAMLRLAIADEPRFVLDDADARSPVPTFTVNTLARLRAELGAGVPLVLIIGADQLLALDTWREWKRLFELAHVAVAERPRFECAPAALAGGARPPNMPAVQRERRARAHAPPAGDHDLSR